MPFIDNIANIYNQGPSNWQARTRGTIDFTSPEGREFTAKWRGGERSLEKKVAIFAYPNVKGNITQDLEVNSSMYPITFFFDGENSDKFGKAFFQAAREKGRWVVVHPVYGYVELQLLSIKQSDQPVTDGGIVTFESEWIEPIDETTRLTAAEMAGLVDIDIDSLNDSLFSEFTDALDASTEALKSAVEGVVTGVANVTDAVLEPLFSTVDALDNAMTIIHNGIQNTLNATVLDVFSLAGQIQSLIQTPALATTSLAATLEYYDDLAEELTNDLPNTSGRLSQKENNQVLVIQLALGSATAARAKATALAVKRAQAAQRATVVASDAAELAGVATVITATGDVIEADPLETRAQAVEFARDLSSAFRAIVESLEDKQKDFESEDVDKQYFSQLQSYTIAAKMTASAAQLLLTTSFDLKVERRFRLDRPRSAIDIAAVEYDGLGEADSNLDLFIRSNNLSGDEIYMLPAGTEVVIYG
jgi:prophage DNA circulation protein